MYNIPTITSALSSVVGFRQQYDTQLSTLDSDLLQSDSGLVFQDAHALITLDNIEAIKPLETEIAFELWDSTKLYKVGAVVKDSSTPYKLYICIKDIPSDGVLIDEDSDGNVEQENSGNIILVNTGSIPLTNTEYWMLTKWTSEWLRQKRNAAIRQVVAAISAANKLSTNARTLLENNNLFEGSAGFGDIEPNMGRFVGYQIDLKDDSSLIDIISRIGTQFSVAALPATFSLYLYSGEQSASVMLIPVTISKQLSLEWTKVNVTLTAGSSWYLGYYEDDIDGNAINKQYNFLTGPCNNCLGQEIAYSNYRKRGKYACITPFAVAGSYLNDSRTLWDVKQNVGYNLKTWGLNFTSTFKCDLTDFITSQSLLFARAIQLQFGCDMISEMAHSPRFNRNQENAQAKAFRALGDKDTPGLYAMLQNEIASVSLDMSALSSICQPCVAARGVSYGSV